jgi:formylglycine-generating enzyme required for sulfatase activity
LILQLVPTDAKWAHSCRAGSTGRWSFGDNEGELLNYARIGSNSQGHPWPVAGLKQNAWGLHDMHGNVWEWCHDEHDPNYYKTGPPKDPPGPGGGERVFRGGSWSPRAVPCRSAFRGHNVPGFRNLDLGFRVLLVLPAGGDVLDLWCSVL